MISDIDGERVEILRKADLKPLSLVELLNRYGFSSIDYNSSVLESIRSSSTISEIRSPNNLNHRYLIEDVGNGLVPMSLIAKIFGVKTQSMDSLVNLASILNKVNHWENGMTLEKMGLKDIHPDMLSLYLKNGTIVC